MHRWLKRAPRNAVSFVMVLMLLAGSVVALTQSGAAGSPVYPDLRTRAPYDLSISRELVGSSSRYRLRFSNQVRNYGGALEVTANLSQSRDLYQNVYDQRIGGSVVLRQRVNSDLIFHPTHNHFHFQGFASYRLLKKNSLGEYVDTALSGTKTSFCMMDGGRFLSDARSSSKYSTCNATKQGLSYGWSDTYHADLPEQFIEFGPSRPADGEYAVISTADPFNKILESNDSNNSSTVYFRISGGQITDSNQGPQCTSSPSSAKVGATVNISCTRLVSGDQLEFRWGSSSGTLLGSATASSENKAAFQFTAPEKSQGVYNIYVKNKTRSETYIATFKITPAIVLVPTSGRNYLTVNFNLTGFSSGERVDLEFRTISSLDIDIVSSNVNSYGTSSGSFAVPLSPGFDHLVTATGQTSDVEATTIFTVTPSMKLSITSGDPGAKVQPWLRGFKGGEQVRLQLDEGGPVLKTVFVGSYGKLDFGNLNYEFQIPAGTVAGTYAIVATGLTSGLKSSLNFLVTAVAPASESESPTPTPTPTATATAAATGVASETATPVPTGIPTEVPTEVATEIPTGVPTEEPTAVPTEEPTEEASPTA